MEYIFYFAAILVAVVLCIYKIASLGRAERLKQSQRSIRKANRLSGKNRAKSAPGELRKTDEIRQRELLKVPTPWGWPGNPSPTHFIHAGKPASQPGEDPATLHRWVDNLVSPKQTKSDEAYLRRRESSMRALLEDRFVSPKKMTEIEYRETKPPLLRDPSETHDQMDNFPAGRIDRIESGLKGSPQAETESSRKIKTIVYEETPALRSPWGW
ncbi:MAG: hypothetical protein V2I48_06895 [Xanthomonadales bacterium]|nr:hypothetical protein [Xanthomonadales bacterium]